MFPCKPTVFLGGTCNNSEWRERLIPLLNVNYFNPVVKDWTPECQAEELRQRKACDYVLYVITPLMTGVYSIAEVVDDSNKRPDKTLFCVLPTEPAGIHTSVGFSEPQLKSLQAVKALVAANGATVLDSLEEVAKWLNARPYDTKLPPSQSW